MVKTPPQICDLLAGLRPRVLAYRESAYRRAVKAYCRAFGREARPGETLNVCVIHNALIDRDRGRPWPEIDYHYLRQARFLLCKQHDADRVIDRLYSRLCREWHAAGCPTSSPNQSVE
jgi:hypothetical protein